ncbi:MAG: hypothetical protein WB801_10910 [Candidatus Dormiibacterota bacterium]
MFRTVQKLVTAVSPGRFGVTVEPRTGRLEPVLSDPASEALADMARRLASAPGRAVMPEQRSCPVCGIKIDDPKHTGKVYCSPAHRAVVHQRRARARRLANQVGAGDGDRHLDRRDGRGPDDPVASRQAMSICARPGCGHEASLHDPSGGCVKRLPFSAQVDCPCPGYRTLEQDAAWAEVRNWRQDTFDDQLAEALDRLEKVYP